MASTAQHEPGTDELVALMSWGSAIAAVALVGLLAIAFVAELLRRRRRAARLVATLDRAVPIAMRTAGVSIVTLVTALVGAQPAGGTDSVRGWLDGSTSTATTTVAPAPSTTRPPTPSTTTTTLAGPTVLAPPVVLDPPVTPQDLEPPASRTSTRAPAPAPPLTPVAPAPAPPVATSDHYVVVRGDCLWSIAEHRLGPGADARSIDAGWRAIYAATRVAIGDDPNLIHPGLTLTLPPLHTQP
jgi:nucleoid-associated protein YgaU